MTHETCALEQIVRFGLLFLYTRFSKSYVSPCVLEMYPYSIV